MARDRQRKLRLPTRILTGRRTARVRKKGAAPIDRVAPPLFTRVGKTLFRAFERRFFPFLKRRDPVAQRRRAFIVFDLNRVGEQASQAHQRRAGVGTSARASRTLADVLGSAVHAKEERLESFAEHAVIVRAPHQTRLAEILKTGAAAWTGLEIVRHKIVGQLFERQVALGGADWRHAVLMKVFGRVLLTQMKFKRMRVDHFGYMEDRRSFGIQAEPDRLRYAYSTRRRYKVNCQLKKNVKFFLVRQSDAAPDSTKKRALRQVEERVDVDRFASSTQTRALL